MLRNDASLGPTAHIPRDAVHLEFSVRGTGLDAMRMEQDLEMTTRRSLVATGAPLHGSRQPTAGCLTFG